MPKWIFIVAFAWSALLFAESSDEKQFAEAMRSVQRKNYARAVSLLGKLAEKKPNNALYWFNLGNAHFTLGNHKKAIHPYRNVMALKSPLSPVAALYLAKTYRKMEKFGEARKLLRALGRKKLPDNVKKELELETLYLDNPYLREGISQYQNKDYKAAVGSFDKSLRRKQTSNALLMKGMALLKLGKRALARNNFYEAINVAKDPSIRAEAQALVNKAEQKRESQGKGYFASIESSLGYNSNVFRDNGLNSPVRKGSFDVLVDLGKRYRLAPNWLGSANYQLYWEELVGLSDFRYISHRINHDFRFKGSDLSGRMYPFFQFQTLGDENFLYKLGLYGHVFHASEPYEFGAIYRLTGNIAAHSVYDYLEGLEHRFSFYGAWEWAHWTSVFSYRFFIQDIGDLSLNGGVLPLNNASHGPEVTVTWKPKDRWKLVGEAGLLFRNYKNLASPGSEERDDTQWRVNFQVWRDIRPKLKAFGLLEYLGNSSTLGSSSVDDQNFSQLTTRIGVSWEIL